MHATLLYSIILETANTNEYKYKFINETNNLTNFVVNNNLSYFVVI